MTIPIQCQPKPFFLDTTASPQAQRDPLVRVYGVAIGSFIDDDLGPSSMPLFVRRTLQMVTVSLILYRRPVPDDLELQDLHLGPNFSSPF